MTRFISHITIIIAWFHASSVTLGQGALREHHLMVEKIRKDYEALMQSYRLVVEPAIGAIHGAGHAEIEVSVVASENTPVEIAADESRSNAMEEYTSFREEQLIPDAWPVKDHNSISSHYGYRKDPFTGKRKFHRGIDIPMPVGTPIYATAAGTVIKACVNRHTGRYVIIDHAGQYRTIYAHLTRIKVETGDFVQKGDHIAHSGNTGRSTGPHLHYQIETPEGESINPLIFFKPQKQKRDENN